MPSIFISGIPKGLDRRTASLRIRKDIETVAQVKTIWIPKEKGYCFVSLHDETSANFVLSLNEKICINGNALRITRWRRKSRLPETPRRTTAPTCKQQVNNDVFVLRGYDTYTNYKCLRPQSDVLYQYIQQTPKQKRLKRKPWKDMNRLSQLSSPKSRKNVRAKRRKCKKKSTRHTKIKQSTSPSEVGLHLVSKRQKNSKFNSACDSDSSTNIPTCFTKKASPLKSTPDSTIRTEIISQRTFDSIQTRSIATVHVYDHSKRQCSIEVDNNNVLESIQAGLDNEQLPSYDTILISHNGKTVTNQWQPNMANDDNIHIVVKGKGGMMQGDPPDEGHHADDKTETKNNDSSGDGTQTADARAVEKSVDESEQRQHIQSNVTSTNPTDDNGITDTGGTQSSADESVNKPEQTPECPTEEKTINPTDDYGSTNTNDTESTEEESVNTFEQTSENSAEENILNPTDDNGITDTSGTGSTVDESVNTSEQTPESPAEKNTLNPTDDNGITDTSGTGSTVDESVNTSVEDGQTNRLILQQVIKSSPFVSTLSQGSEAYQASLIKNLDLGDCFPDQLTYASVMCINENEKDEADTLADIPRLILRKLIMLDFTSRENDLNVCLAKITKRKEEPLVEESSSLMQNEDFLSLFDNDEDTQDKSSSNLESPSPVDIFLSIFICLHPTLKQKVCLKMFACHLAIPIIFPVRRNERHGKTLLFSMWPLRSITVHDGQTDTSLINCKQNIVSFVRLGRPQISKSKLANEILYDTAHNAFFNYDCMLGSSEKKASVGLVEAAWFVPSPKQPRGIRTVTVFLNLRGDALNNAEQMEYLKRVSRVMIIVTDKETMKNKQELEYFKRANFNVLFLLIGNVSKDFTKKYKQFYMKSSPDGFNAEFISVAKHGKNIGLSEIKETILNGIGSLLNDTNSAKTVQEICEQARTMGIIVDEDMPTYKNGRIQANKIFNKVKDCPLADIKLKFTPLQKTNWQEFTDAMKTFRKPGSDLKEKESLKLKMELQRTQQWDIYTTGNPFIKDFITTFSTLDGDSLVSFLDSLKFEFDENSRKKMPIYRQDYALAWEKFQSKTEADKAQAKKKVSEAENKLSEASFGIEHIFRELGQIYEASLMAKESELGPKLAKAVARSIKQGYPFELMDGDVANVPLKWVKRIFEELKHILGDATLLTLSILGLQSSGKSTLLNAMFGLTFSVSAGRCTRGIYLQLFPVQKQTFNFDYVLVVDTEGLRAPELGEQKYQHDNELATLVLGMADITIVNIKGENTSEVKDILQICVHAFLRLKMANQSLQLRQSCIFIHQNVSDVGAKDSMIHARKKLDETLDRMTMEAAEEENISDIKCFKDVINFDSNKHVWYFSDLWKGDPPMAPANPGYSRDVQDVKSCIFKTLTKHKPSYLTISNTFVHIEDLWHGILANDFVFSFRNTLEIKAYNALEKEYQGLIWNLERYTKQLTDDAEVEMKQCTADCEKDKGSDRGMSNYTDKIHDKYRDKFREKESQLKSDLKTHFEESDKKDEIAKWKHSKLCSWDVFAEEYLGKLKRQLTDIESNCRVDYEMNTSHEKLKKEIYDQAKLLAEQIKDKEPSTVDMEKDFNDMWDKWIRKLDVQEEDSIKIELLLESILFETFHKHKDVLQTELDKHPFGRRKSFKTLENNLDDIIFDDNCISVKRGFFKRVKDNVVQTFKTVQEKKDATTARTSAINSETNDEAIRFTNIILKDIDARFKDLKTKEWKFDATEIKEIPKRILQHINQHNQDPKSKFTLLEPYKVKLCVYVFRIALPLLEELDSDYRKKHGMKAKLNKQKVIVRRHFQDVVEEKSATIIACDRFCEIIRDKVEEKVKSNIPDLIYEHIVNDFEQAKFVLIARIMEDLAEKGKSETFLEYINDPSTYAFTWLTKLINSKCFGDSDHLYMAKASAELQTKFEVIINTVKKKSASCLHDWLINVQSEIKDTVWIQMESFSVVEDQKVTDLEDFKTTVAKKLGEVHIELKDNFRSEKVTTIQWSTKKTPYELVMEKLWGCEAICPFCHEPCKWNKNHGTEAHLCIQHRAMGVAGRRWKHTGLLVSESCSFEVHSTHLFRCSTICKGGKCTILDRTEHFHPFKEYKSFIPKWNIAPCPDISSSKYWAWVLCTFNEEFATHYNCKKADIPLSWKRYTEDDAIESIRE